MSNLPAGYQAKNNIVWGMKQSHPGLLEIAISNSKKKNAIGIKEEETMTEVIKSAQTDDNVKVILLHGGRFFSSGNDLSAFFTAKTEEEMRQMGRHGVNVVMVNMILSLATSKKPVVAVVRGGAIGVGYTLLAHTTFIYCGPEARFMTPFMKSAQSPEGTSTLLFPRIFGQRMSNEILLGDRWINAQEALKFGFVNGIIDSFDPKSDEVDPDKVPIIKKLLETDY